MFYIELFSALARHHVDYLLIGGLAVSLHGVERATMDIACIDDLIALKEAVGRPIDLSDIAHLKRINKL